MSGCRPIASALVGECAHAGMAHLAAGLVHAALGTAMRVQHAAALDAKLISMKQRSQADTQVGTSHSISQLGL